MKYKVQLTSTFTAAGLCMLIKQKCLRDPRLTFDIVDTSQTEDINYLLQARKLGYSLNVEKKAYCVHRHDREALRFGNDDLKTLVTVKLVLSLCFPKVFFWETTRHLEPQQVCNPPNSDASPEGRAFAVQTGPKTYGLLSGKLQGNREVTVFTPTIPLEISDFDLFKTVYMTNLFKKKEMREP